MKLFKPNVEKMLAQQDVNGLVKTLADEKKAMGDAARDALIKIGEPAIPALSAAVSDPQARVRLRAAWALGDCGEKATGAARAQAAEALIAALHDADSIVRQNAAAGLGQIGDTRAVEPLIAGLADDSDNSWQAVRKALIALGGPAVPSLIAALHHEQPRVRRGAAWALGDIGDRQALDPMLQALGDADAIVRQNAASALGQLGDPRAIRPLALLLEDAAMPTRRNAAWALGELGGAKAAAPWSARLSDADPEARSAAEQAVRGLLALSIDSEKEACEAASGALSGLGDAAPQALVAALADGDGRVTRAAAGRLSEMGSAAVAALAPALQAEDAQVRRLAVGVLRDIAGKSAESNAMLSLNMDTFVSALADTDDAVARTAADILVALGVDAAPPLHVALRSEAPRARAMAARALGEIGAMAKQNAALGADIVATLTDLLRDAAGEVRAQAASGLGSLGDRQALAAVSALENDPDPAVRQAVYNARQALGWRPPPPPAGELAKEFNDIVNREGMNYVAGRHSRGLLIDQAELRRVALGAAVDAMRSRYGLDDDEIQAVYDYAARGPQATPAPEPAPQDTSALIADLGNSDQSRSAEAEAALYNAGQEIVPAIIDVLQHSQNQGARRQSAWILYKIAERITDPQLRDQTVLALIDALQDQDEGLRRNAPWALSVLGGRAIPALQAAANDPSADVRDAVAFALKRLGVAGE